MNENLEKSLSSILDKSLELAEKTGQFVIEQGGELLEQFFLWRTTSASFTAILGLLIIFVGFIIVKILGKKRELRENELVSRDFYGCRRKHEQVTFLGVNFSNGSDSFWASCILFGVLSLGGTITSLYGLYNLLYILIAPKLYIIDYFTNINC